MIVEKSADRLTLRLSRHASTGVCALDRTRGVTTVTKFAFLIPYRRSRIPLSLIRNVFVRRNHGAQAYYPVLETVRGARISIGECTKADALAAVKAIRDFLRAPATASV